MKGIYKKDWIYTQLKALTSFVQIQQKMYSPECWDLIVNLNDQLSDIVKNPITKYKFVLKPSFTSMAVMIYDTYTFPEYIERSL